MTYRSSVRNRILTLVGAVGLMGAAAFPLMGLAQNSSPVASPASGSLISEGELIYKNVCIACHQPDGKGIEGIYLPLDGNPLVAGDDPTYLVSTVLTGRGGMPTFANLFSDEEIAAVSSYVRQEWSNDASEVSVEQVADVRSSVIQEQTNPGQRHGGGSSGGGDATPEAESGGAAEATPAGTP